MSKLWFSAWLNCISQYLSNWLDLQTIWDYFHLLRKLLNIWRKEDTVPSSGGCFASFSALILQSHTSWQLVWNVSERCLKHKYSLKTIDQLSEMIKNYSATLISFEVAGGSAEGSWFQTLLIQWHFITSTVCYHALIYFEYGRQARGWHLTNTAQFNGIWNAFILLSLRKNNGLRLFYIYIYIFYIDLIISAV